MGRRESTTGRSLTRIERSDITVGVRGSRLAVRRLDPEDSDPRLRPVVLLHEALGSIAQWKRFPERLSAATGRPVLAYDRRGHGLSDPLTAPRGAAYLHRAALDELPAVLEATGVERPVLVGHSDGGTIALLYAAACPAEAVVSIAGHVFVEEAAREGIRRTLEALDRLGIRDRLERYHGDKTDALLRAWAETWLAPWFDGWDVRSAIGRVRCPVLVIQGADDEYATQGHVDEIAAAVGGPAETWLVPGQRHAPHLTAGDLVVERLAQWLDRV